MVINHLLAGMILQVVTATLVTLLGVEKQKPFEVDGGFKKMEFIWGNLPKN